MRGLAWQATNVLGRSHLMRLLSGWFVGQDALHTELAMRLRQLINDGELPAGIRLPSERALATGIGVSRNTVGTAFDLLRGEGVLVSRQGDGTYVSSAGRGIGARGDDRLRSFVIGHANDGLIDLRSAALPGLEMVADELSRLVESPIDDLLETHGYIPGGLPDLRAAIASYYVDLGLATTPDGILVTSGAQQALRLIATTLLEPGDFVLVEEPTFRGAIEVLRAAGGRLVPVPSGQGGVDVSALTAIMRRVQPALVMLQSGAHNPTGAMLDEYRRVGVARLSEQTGVTIVDDAAVSDALIDDRPHPRPLAAFGGNVITIGSASKSFWGGLRVGWVRSTPTIVRQLTSVKGAEDLGTSLIAQLLTIRLLRRIDEARAERSKSLESARDAILADLSERLPDWNLSLPSGGASLWVRLPSTGATEFAQRAERSGVAVLAGPTFSCRDGLDDHIRISYAAPIDRVLDGVGRLAEVWRH